MHNFYHNWVLKVKPKNFLTNISQLNCCIPEQGKEEKLAFLGCLCHFNYSCLTQTMPAVSVGKQAVKFLAMSKESDSDFSST